MKVLLALALLVSATMAYPPADRSARDRLRRADLRDTFAAFSRLYGDSCLPAEGVGAARGGSVDRDSLNMRCVGRWPFGSCWKLALSDRESTDHLMFLGAGYGVRILDISNRGLPSTVGKIDLLGTMRYGGIAKKDTLLYVLSGFYGLEIFSISTPASPRKLGEYLLPIINYDLAVKDSFVYIVGFDSLIHVIAVEDPGHCREVAVYGPLSDHTEDCCIQGNVLYVAAKGAGFVALDISDPHHPSVLGTVSGISCVRVVADGEYAYVANGAEVMVISIADPRSMNVVGRTSSVPAGALCKCGFLLYTVNTLSYSTQFAVIDVSQPNYPTLVSETLAVGWAYDVAGVGLFGYAYTADYWGGLHVIDVRDPVQPVVDTALFRAVESMGVAVANGYALLPQLMNSSVPILDVSSPGPLREVGVYDTSQLYPRHVQGIAALDTFAYVWDFGLRVINFSDPAHPFLASRRTLVALNAYDMTATDSLLFVGLDNKLSLFDITDPAHPRPRDSALLGTQGAIDVAVDGNRAYVSCGGPMRIFDFTNPDSLEPIGYFGSNIMASAARGSILFAATNGVGIVAWAVGNPSNPFVIGEDTNWTVLNFSDVALWGDKLVVLSWGCIRVLDVSDPTNMREIGHYAPIGGPQRVAVDSSFIYVACFEAGLSILELLPSGIAENTVNTGYVSLRGDPTIVRGVLEMPEATSRKPQAASFLLDIAGRKVQDLHPGPNDVSRLAPGVYFVRGPGLGGGGRGETHKVVIQR